MNVSQITSKINTFFSSIDSMITKVVPMPAILLLCAAMSRQGLSPLRSLNNICAAMEGLGIPTTSNPDGSPNLIVNLLYATLKEIYRAQTEDAGGPVVTIGTNLMPTHTWGVIQ